METLYARITTIRARGQTGGAEAKLAAYLNKLTEDEYFDRDRAERYLLLARDLPGYNVQLTLRPAGTGPGDLVGEVSVLHRPYSVDVTVQNLAAQETGRWGGQVRGQVFGLTGLGDVTTLLALFDVRLQGAEDPAGRAQLPPRVGGADDRRAVHLRLDQARRSARNERRPDLKAQDAVLDDRRALSDRPAAVVEPVGRRSGSISSTRRSISSGR